MPRIIFEIVEVVLFRRRPDPEFLVLHRSEEEDIYPGLWQIVSGGIEPGEKAYEAAFREIKEETGLTPIALYNTPLTNTFYFYTTDSVNVSPVFAAEVKAADDVRLSNEHEEFRWLTEKDAVSLLVWPGQKSAIRIIHDYIVLKNPSREFMMIPLDSFRR
jgi:dihydroneopterin triphosphate diphosphatase